VTAEQLIVAWRARAAELAPFAPAAATAFERAADELAAALRDRDDRTLTLRQAATLSGYSADHLGRLIRAGKLRNVGRPHAPRVQPGDLPRKPPPLDATRRSRQFRDVRHIVLGTRRAS
jgi:hypothetical protein